MPLYLAIKIELSTPDLVGRVVLTRGIQMAANTLPAVVAHGAARLPSVQVDDYNVELQDDEGFIGDRASKSAFRDIVSHWRTVLQEAGVDPLGDEETHALSKKAL